MPRPTTRRSPAPSQFPNTSVNQFNRRKLLAGAGAALGAGVRPRRARVGRRLGAQPHEHRAPAAVVGASR